MAPKIAIKFLALQILLMGLLTLSALDLYGILGVDKKADDKTIKKAYKKAAVRVMTHAEPTMGYAALASSGVSAS